jgi:hypothetical protein
LSGELALFEKENRRLIGKFAKLRIYFPLVLAFLLSMSLFDLSSHLLPRPLLPPLSLLSPLPPPPSLLPSTSISISISHPRFYF